MANERHAILVEGVTAQELVTALSQAIKESAMETDKATKELEAKKNEQAKDVINEDNALDIILNTLEPVNAKWQEFYNKLCLTLYKAKPVDLEPRQKVAYARLLRHIEMTRVRPAKKEE